MHLSFTFPRVKNSLPSSTSAIISWAQYPPQTSHLPNGKFSLGLHTALVKSTGNPKRFLAGKSSFTVLSQRKTPPPHTTILLCPNPLILLHPPTERLPDLAFLPFVKTFPLITERQVSHFTVATAQLPSNHILNSPQMTPLVRL